MTSKITKIEALNLGVTATNTTNNVYCISQITEAREKATPMNFLESINKSDRAKIQKVVQKLQSAGMVNDTFELSHQSQIEDIYIAFSVLAKFVDNQSSSSIAASTAKGYLPILRSNCTERFQQKHTDPSFARYSFSRLVLSNPEVVKHFTYILTEEAKELFKLAIEEENQRVDKSNQPKEFQFKRTDSKSKEEVNKSFLFATLDLKYTNFEAKLAGETETFGQFCREVFAGEITQFFRETANRLNVSSFMFSSHPDVQTYRDLLLKVIDSATNQNKTLTIEDIESIDNLTVELHIKYKDNYLIDLVTTKISKVYDTLNFINQIRAEKLYQKAKSDQNLELPKSERKELTEHKLMMQEIIQRVESFDSLKKCEAANRAVCSFENHKTPNNLAKMKVNFGKDLSYAMLSNGDFGKIITCVNSKINEFYGEITEQMNAEAKTIEDLTIESQVQEFINELPKNRREELDFLQINLPKSYNKALSLFEEIIKAGSVKSFMTMSLTKGSGVLGFKGHPMNQNKDYIAFYLIGGDRVVINKQSNLIEVIGDPKSVYSH